MSDTLLRSQLIRLAHSKPELRAQILPLLAQGKQAGCEKLPEGGMRDNCEEKRDEAKQASGSPKHVSGWEMFDYSVKSRGRKTTIQRYAPSLAEAKADAKKLVDQGEYDEAEVLGLAKGKGADKKAHGAVALRNPDVMLYYIDKAANSSKFYEMKVAPTSNGYVLQRRWGRLTDSGATGRVDSADTPFGDEASAFRVMYGFKTEKMRKGYKDAVGKYPIGLGAAGFGWGGQAACAYVPELKLMATNVSKATVDLNAAGATLAALARRESGMAKDIAAVYAEAMAGLSKLDSYLAKQLSAC